MVNLKPLLVCSCLLLSLSAFCQTNDSTVFLKWKLKPGEVITYKTVMNEMDTANHKDMDMSGMMRSIGIKDTADITKMRKMMATLNKEIQNYDLVTQMTEKRKGVVDIAMSAIDKDKTPPQITGKTMDDSLRNIGKMLGKLASGVKLRGAVYEDGSIESFYTKNDQRNLLSIFFELPAKKVKVGDTWALDVHLLSADEHFVCDSSSKRNVVTLVAVENINGEHIATLKYDIQEYMHGDFKSPMEQGSQTLMMKMTHHAIARFSIEKGRWVFYEGVMSLSSSGAMASQTTKKLSLIAE